MLNFRRKEKSSYQQCTVRFHPDTFFVQVISQNQPL